MNPTRTTTSPVRRWRHTVAGLALAALLTAPLAACGGDEEIAPSAAEQVPALATQLDRIDLALANRRFARARNLLDRLVQQVIDARDSGDLDADASDRILAAVSRLLRQLPEPSPEPAPTVTVPPTLPDPDDDDDDDDDDKDDDKRTKQRKEAEKKAEEAQKKRAEESKKREEKRKQD